MSVVCPFYLRYHIPIPSARWFLVDPLGLYLPTSHDHHEHHPLGPKPGALEASKDHQASFEDSTADAWLPECSGKMNHDEPVKIAGATQIVGWVG